MYAQLSTPLMWRFLQEVPRRENAWAADIVARLTQMCGEYLRAVWKVRLTAREAPALQAWLADGRARLGDLLRSPDDRNEPLHAVPLLLARAAGGENGTDVEIAPDDDILLTPNDELLFVGWPSAHRLLDATLLVDSTREYVVHGRHVPSSWVWRKLTRRPA